MAAAESAKPSDVDSQGSAIIRSATASESTDMPTAGRPRSTASIAAPAIAAARTTLGSGVTSTTKPASAATPHPTRTRRPRPASAAAPKAMPTTSAQFAPDTAVRCDSDDRFIAASSSGPTRDVSPTARPGTSPAPGSGRPTVARSSPRRRPEAMAAAPEAGATTSRLARRDDQHGPVARLGGVGRPLHEHRGAHLQRGEPVDLAGSDAHDHLDVHVAGHRARGDARRDRIEREFAGGAPLDLSDDVCRDGDGAAAVERHPVQRRPGRLGEGDVGCRGRRGSEGQHRDDPETGARTAHARARRHPRGPSPSSSSATAGAIPGASVVAAATAHAAAATGTSRNRAARRITP